MNDVVKRAEELLQGDCWPTEWCDCVAMLDDAEIIIRDFMANDSAIRVLCGELPEAPSRASTVDLVRNVCENLVKAAKEAKEWKESVYQHNDRVADLEELRDDLKERIPDLHAVINWLNSGCNPKDAAKELEIYQGRIDKPFEE